jgi:hypothetical protein
MACNDVIDPDQYSLHNNLSAVTLFVVKLPNGTPRYNTSQGKKLKQST